MTDNEYRIALIQELSRSLSANHEDNYDVRSLGPEPSTSVLKRPIPHSGRENLFEENPVRYFEELFGDRLNIGEYLFTRLADQSSRDLLIKLMAFRLLGYRHVKLPRNTPEYWQGIERVISMKTETPPLPINW